MRATASIFVALTAACLTTIDIAPAIAAAAPCNGIAQIADASFDGHHANTDVTAAWLSEQSGLQAVIRLRIAAFVPAHEDSEAAGFALLYELGGAWRYVRAQAPRTGAMQYDHGTWTSAGGFASAGATTGAVEPTTSGTVTIDLPAVPAGAKLARPFVLTYDGEDSPGQLHWVDRAPGGTSPTTTEFGADFVVGACGLGGGVSPTPGTPAAGSSGGGSETAPVSAVDLLAVATLTGGGTVRATGVVRPARAGVAVSVRAQRVRAATYTTTTAADGSFVIAIPVHETTALRATADGVSSQTRTVTVISKVRVRLRRAASGTVTVTGQVWPRLPGRILWLREGAASATATTAPTAGRFRLRLKRPRDGRYQAVFIPSGHRAERSTSNTGVIR